MPLERQIRYVFAADTTASDGSGKTGLAFGDITAKYLIQGGTLTSLTTETISTLGTYQAPTSASYIRIKELSSIDPAKGMYEVHFHDTQLATGSRLWLLLSASGAKFVPLEVDLATKPAIDAIPTTAAPTASANASAVRTELTTELGRIDAAIGTRLATDAYTAPDNSSITTIKNKTDNLPASPAATGDIPSPSSIASSVRTELTTELGRVDAAVSTRLADSSYTAPDNAGIAAIGLVVINIDNRLPSDPADASVIAASFADVINAVGEIELDPSKLLSGGGTLNARVAFSSIAPDEYIEIVQGEAKILTLIAEANGRFDSASADSISIDFEDPEGTVINKTNAEIIRITEQLDIQVLRVILEADETELLTDGLLRIQITFDTQRAILTHSVKIVEAV